MPPKKPKKELSKEELKQKIEEKIAEANEYLADIAPRKLKLQNELSQLRGSNINVPLILEVVDDELESIDEEKEELIEQIASLNEKLEDLKNNNNV